MRKIVASVGDFYHREEWARQSLEAALVPLLAADWELSYADASDLAHSLENGPSLVVLFKENRLNPEDEQVKEWMDAQVSRQIERYVREGGSWLAWHSGLASYPEDSEYVHMLRGWFEFHPEQHQVTRYTPSAEFGGGPSFAFLDEHYFVRCAEEETEIFLRSESVDGTSIAGWRHNYGHGRVCCLSPAHRLEGLTDPDFMETLYNCVKWCVQES